MDCIPLFGWLTPYTMNHCDWVFFGKWDCLFLPHPDLSVTAPHLMFETAAMPMQRHWQKGWHWPRRSNVWQCPPCFCHDTWSQPGSMVSRISRVNQPGSAPWRLSACAVDVLAGFPPLMHEMCEMHEMRKRESFGTGGRAMWEMLLWNRNTNQYQPVGILFAC